MNCLIVDDYPTNLKLLRAQLEFEGHAVFEAYDGVDALALLERQRVDVVISEILMPRMDGYRLCQEIRRHARLRDLPIIIYTSTYTTPEEEKLALESGANKYLKKPVSVATIVAALHQAIVKPDSVPRPDVLREVEVLKNYNQLLVSKLEDKNTELMDAELKFHALVEQSIVGIYITQDDQFVYVNPEMKKIFGWSEGEMTSRTLYDFIVPEEHALVREYIRKRISAEVPSVHYSLRMLHRSGGVLQVEVHGSRTDYNGRPAVMGMLVDITERKRVEEATQRSQKRLRDLIDGLGSSMFVGLMTVQGIMIECNRPALAAAGLKLEDVLGKHFEETYWWAYSQEVQQQLREAIARGARGEASRYDVQLRAAENDLIEVDFSLQPLRDETGEVVFLVPSAIVITERARAQALLKGQKRVLEMIAAGEPLGESLTALVRLIETHAPGMLGSILLLDEDGVHLRNGASPSLPPEYVTAIDGISIGPSAGSCGTAAYNKEAVAVEDIATDPRWADYKAVALPHGLRACWSTPIFDAQRRVIGTFAMYYRQSMLAHPDHQRLIDVAVHAAAIAIGRYRTETALHESAEQLRLAVQASNVGLWSWDLRTNQVSYSRESKSHLGYEESEIRNEFSEWERLVHPEDLAAVQERIQRYLAQPVRAYETEYRMRHKDGTWRWIYARGEFFRDASGEAMRMMGCHIDITERKAAERTIAHLNRVYAMLSGINSLIVRMRDRDELFKEACRIAVDTGAFRMAWIGVVDVDTGMVHPAASFGDHADEYLQGIEISVDAAGAPGQGPIATSIRENQPAWIQDFQHNLRSAPWHERGAHFDWGASASLPLHRNGVPIGALILYAGEVDAFDDEEKRLLLELAGDIEFAMDHLDKQERLTYLAYYDVLTGLANRTLFLDRVAQHMRSAVSGGHQLALFLIDLERFRSINDSLGRRSGDDLLRQVAQWLIRNAAGDANLLARVDADHFAVVMPVVKQEGNLGRLLAKWTEAFLGHPFHLSDAVFRISAKVGVAVFPDDGADADTLFRNAEAALKKAKPSGERYLLYTRKMTSLVAGKLALENQLRQAIDKGEFVLYYQPKVNLASGKMTSAEALIRWNDPHTGLVPPGRFIPILEETGMIYEVGRWALHQAIKDYLRWRAAGLPAVRIAVNVSPLQLRNRGFIAEIEQAIGIDAQAAAGLEIEITESLIMEDVQYSIASLQAIRAMGVTIAIDDFGTGFSSLSYLAKLPVDTLKIDRSFVIDMTARPQGLALVSTIINLAHALNLKVVAEGVETEEQSRLLRVLNCDEMQGYLFSEAVPGEIFETKFLARPPRRGMNNDEDT